MRFLFFNLLIISVLVASCSAGDINPDIADTPVFGINGNLSNGDTLNFMAGIDDYYLFTYFEKEANNVHVFSGEFREINCENDCRETLKISFRDKEATNNVDINTTLIAGQNYVYKGSVNNGIDTLQKLTLEGTFDTPFAENPSYTWSLLSEGINSTFNEQNININLSDISPVEARLLVSDSVNNCGSEIRKVLFPNGLGTICAVDFLVETSQQGGTTLSIDPTSLTNPPYVYSWNTGENSDSIMFNAAGNYCVTVTDADGCESFICKDLSYGQMNEVVVCAADFSHQIEEEYVMIEDSLGLELGTVLIEYVDAAGKIWRSDRANQALNTTFFTIDNVEEYERNENDEATKLMSIRYSVTLFDEDLNELELTDSEGVIAISYPN